MSGMAWVRLIDVERCQSGRGVFVEVGGHKLAVFCLADPPHFAAIDNACPHADGNLFAGQLEGRVVSCPMHHWRFDVVTGLGTHSRAARVSSYPVEIRDGALYADLDAHGR